MKFAFQAKFEASVNADWWQVYTRVKDNFHTGWKEIVGAPSLGNFNPNYKDVQVLCERVIQEHATALPIPVWPFEMRTPMTHRHGEDAWSRSYYYAGAWELLAREGFKRPQLSGALRHLLDSGSLDDWDETVILAESEIYYSANCPHLLPAHVREVVNV